MPSGTTRIVEALDTCSDGDKKNNDCTKNANKNGGVGNLIDLEESTARRFYGGTPKDNAAIEWRWKETYQKHTSKYTHTYFTTYPQSVMFYQNTKVTTKSKSHTQGNENK